MSDDTVRAALRSEAPLVVIEAPAGCGKTYQGADYASEVASTDQPGRPLILTHTHAACSVFAERVKGHGTRVDIRTIDSVIGQIASVYHAGLGLPEDIPRWLRQQGDTGYQQLAAKVARLMTRRSMIAAAIARRYPVVVCDEHQDSNGDQHAAVMALLEQGSRIRVLADPMQKIFRDKRIDGARRSYEWDALTTSADAFETLDCPHRWNNGCPRLGQWTLQARELLKANDRIDLRDRLPPSVSVVYAENKAQNKFGFRMSREDRRSIDRFQRKHGSLLILTHYNGTAESLRGFFGRRISLWEGHMRPNLEQLVDAVRAASGNPAATAEAVAIFLQGVAGKGLSASAFGKVFCDEVRNGCIKPRRGKPARIQELAKFIVDDPSHRGLAAMLRQLLKFSESEPAFNDVGIDYYKELWDAIRLADFDNPEEGLLQITHRRSYARPTPPDVAISTIHKAKGLECESVIVTPCNASNFRDTAADRCLLYVALSRARSHLMLVVSRDNPSPLFVV